MPTETDRPLIVFVHVPKTAGSTVNRALRGVLPNGLDHCEAILDDPARLRRAAARLDWISGHVDLTTLRRALRQATSRPLRFFGAVRTPDAQVASHYNWLIEIHNRGSAFYGAHPRRIREISERLRGTDNSDPAAIIDNIRSWAGLFLNQQSQLILGTDFNWNTGQVPKRLRAYEFVATERMIDPMLRVMTGRDFPTPLRENASPYHFDRSVFETPSLRNFLLRNNYLDWMLYRSLQDAKLRAAVAPHFTLKRAARAPQPAADGPSLIS